MSKARRARIFAAANGLCHICEGKIGAGEPWDAEHVIPLEISGDDSDENIRPAHPACHRKKNREDARNIAKAKRVHAKHNNTYRPTRNPIPGSKGHWAKRKINGTTVRRDEE